MLGVAEFPSPHPGIINFFSRRFYGASDVVCFRPLIRGLSISSDPNVCAHRFRDVSVPSSGDYQFLRELLIHAELSIKFPSPHPGIINFFESVPYEGSRRFRFRPLIRGLSISSGILKAVRRPFNGFRPLIRGLSISSDQRGR